MNDHPNQAAHLDEVRTEDQLAVTEEITSLEAEKFVGCIDRPGKPDHARPAPDNTTALMKTLTNHYEQGFETHVLPDHPLKGSSLPGMDSVHSH